MIRFRPGSAVDLASSHGAQGARFSRGRSRRGRAHALPRNHPLRAATSAAESLAFLQTGDFDVLVSDIGMAGEDGYSLIRRVRTLASAQGGATPAIALTAYARIEDREQPIAAGFQRRLVKPIEPGDLISMIAGLSGTSSPGAPRPSEPRGERNARER